MKKIIGILIAFSTLGYCVTSFSQSSERALSAKELTLVKDMVGLKLKDPYSAQYSNLRINENGMVCGLLNAKNSYGAYIGNKGFTGKMHTVSKKSNFELIAIANNEEEFPAGTLIVKVMCSPESSSSK